jgi:hypothetical protein
MDETAAEPTPPVVYDQPTIDAAVKVILDRIPSTHYAGDARLLRIAANLVRKLGAPS